MKRVLVYDVAAESSGAKAVLEKYIESFRKDGASLYYVVTSVLDYPSSENAEFIKLKWCKKSWLHRLYCDYVYMPRLIKKLNIDEIFSLQNIILPIRGLKQTVLVHNAIPFTDHRFSLFSDSFLFIYQNLIGHLIKKSCKKADKIIVQTKWMKKKISELCKLPLTKIELEKREEIRALSAENERIKNDIPTFFYPAMPFSYKNHRVILEACRNLKNSGITDFKVVFTFTGDENKLAGKIKSIIQAEKLPIELVPTLNCKAMDEMYGKSVLLFPSYLETVGLPLLEAQAFRAKIIAADCAYSREALENYEAEFFDYTSAEALALKMREVIHEN